MKLFSTILLGSAVILAFSCKKNDSLTVRPIKANMKLSFNDKVKDLNLSPAGATVKLTNQINAQTIESKTDASGNASFESIAPGIYNISATITIADTTYSRLSGTIVTDDVVFNASATGLPLNKDNDTTKLELVSGRIGNWVFKQIYYAGSNTSKGASFRDQFIEIYNNSTDTLYADSLYFGQVAGVNNTDNNSTLPGYLANSQYDWSKAKDGSNVVNAAANANENYVYLKSLFMLPRRSNGLKYAVAPGQSIIIAQTGMNHQAPYSINGGTTQAAPADPSLTIDLSGADFETYLVEYLRTQFIPSSPTSTYSPYKWDVDAPAVTNVEVLHAVGMNDMILDARGRDAFVIIEAGSNNDPRNWKAYATPDVTTVTASTNLYIQAPISTVVDAVEIRIPTNPVPQRLPNSLSAAPAFVTGGQYSSQSLVRKTARTVGTRRVLQDTNNSESDFFTKTKADPSKTEASFQP